MRFHVEHDLLATWLESRNAQMDTGSVCTLNEFARMIFDTNQQYNLTGLKTVADIIATLIIGSLEPFISFKVPRGTIFADIGTGAGVPGIPLAVYSGAWKGILIDSNNKKVSFVRSVIEECGLANCEAVSGRIEELARGSMRAACDFVFSRALGEMYYAVELAAPLLKKGGLLYVYSNVAPGEVPAPVVRHAGDVGLSLVDRERFGDFGIGATGVAFEKTGATDRRYPRNMSQLKREMKQCARNNEPA